MGNGRNKQHDDSLITQASYARLRGLNRSTVNRQVRSKLIPTHGGLIDLVEADKARRENLYLGRGGKRTARMAPVIASKVGRLAGKSNRVKAGLRDLDTKFRAAKLPILEGEDRLWATNMLELSDSLLRLGPELCDRLASETSPVRCEEIISNFVSRELSELSDFEIGMGSRDPR